MWMSTFLGLGSRCLCLGFDAMLIMGSMTNCLQTLASSIVQSVCQKEIKANKNCCKKERVANLCWVANQSFWLIALLFEKRREKESGVHT
jgi:hypothetical protein